jgi:hypothetical protein
VIAQLSKRSITDVANSRSQTPDAKVKLPPCLAAAPPLPPPQNQLNFPHNVENKWR